MVTQISELQHKHCASCEEDLKALSKTDVQRLLKSVPDWKLVSDGKRIRREWAVKDFAAGMEFFQNVADLAEMENHHPDLHLSDYRNLAIELSTHAVEGLSENDFILAAKIDELPIELKA